MKLSRALRASLSARAARHAAAGREALRTGLHDGDRAAVFELDDDLLAVLLVDLALDRVAEQPADRRTLCTVP
ncbi:MAG TPA: hypothetical protein VFX94_12615 [Burkholderiales bacterium]|nr:hypothetical protein [Burkholderiales bacterium]